MTYKDKFYSETDWRKRVLIVELFHLQKLAINSNWRIVDTAKAFEKSIALVSENLELAKHIRDNRFDDCPSREKAMKILRKERE